MSSRDRSFFVTLGTHDQAFARALELVAKMARHGHVRVQHGETPADPALSGVEWFHYLDFAQMRSEMAAADVVACHAGVGSTISALRAGKLPILLPRLARHGEHVDDHQLQLADRFAAAGLALVYDGSDGSESVAALLESAAVGAPPGSVLGDGRLQRALARAAGLADPLADVQVLRAS